MSLPLDVDDLAAALGGERHLIEFYEITPRDGVIEVTACIEAACEARKIDVGRSAGSWTFSLTVTTLAERLVGMQQAQTPTIGTFEALSANLRGLPA